MTFSEFIQRWSGQGIDEDGSYGFQCVDLVQQYSKEVLGIPRWGSGNAIGRWENYPKDKFERISNTPTGVPQYGDIVIWGKQIGEFGHIAVFISGNAKNFNSFDQNFPLKSLCHTQSHTYKGVLGWLRLKVAPPPPTPPPPPSDPCASVRADLADCQTKLTSTEKQLTDANAVAVELEGQLQLMSTRVVTAENEVKIIDTASKDLKTAYDELDRKLTACNSDLLACDSKPPTVIVKPIGDLTLGQLWSAILDRIFDRKDK